LSDNADIVNIISLIASGVSIALAIIAIWWGQVNNSQTSKIYDKIYDKIDGVKDDTVGLHTKIVTMQKELIQAFHESIDSAEIPIEKKEEIKETIDLYVRDIALVSLENGYWNYGIAQYLEFEREIYDNIQSNLVEGEALEHCIKDTDCGDIVLYIKNVKVIIELKVRRFATNIMSMEKFLPKADNCENINEIYSMVICAHKRGIDILAKGNGIIKFKRITDYSVELPKINIKEEIISVIKKIKDQ
jgi:hypothetical protein